MTISAPTNTENNRSGSGTYKPLKRRKQEDEKKKTNLQEELELLDKRDRRMRFKNAKDPVYVAFDYLDKQPLKKLAADFVRDSLAEVMIFISKFN